MIEINNTEATYQIVLRSKELESNAEACAKQVIIPINNRELWLIEQFADVKIEYDMKKFYKLNQVEFTIEPYNQPINVDK